MDCNAATRNVPPWFCGGGVSGIPAAVRRDVHCRSSGCLLSFVGMPGTRRADALHYIRVGVGTKQRRHRNKVWKAL
jgi:hypothetical protein